MITKEQLRPKIMEAWRRGWIKISPSTDWGFVNLSSEFDNCFLGISQEEYFYDVHIIKAIKDISREVKQIENSPLMKALK